MPLTMRHSSGDGVAEDLAHINVTLADDGRHADISGIVQKIGADQASTVAGSVIAPPVPLVGSTFWLVQVDLASGALSEKQSPDGTPEADPDNLVVLQLELQADPATDPAAPGVDDAATA